MSATKPTKAPMHLKPATRRWFDGVIAGYELEPHHLKLLLAAAESWDRADDARRILATEGLCITDRFNQRRAHPMVNVERDMKGLFARLVRELGLDIEGPADSRPPRLGGQEY